ncbi:hypothetical protein [Streptomyces sp. NPDC002520]
MSFSAGSPAIRPMSEGDWATVDRSNHAGILLASAPVEGGLLAPDDAVWLAV